MSVKPSQLAAYVFRSAEDTLIFCYDAERASRNGETWEIPETIDDECDVPWQEEGIKRLVIEPSFQAFQPTSTACWFCGLNQLETLEGLHYLDTSKVTKMNSMFSDCALSRLDLSHFDTAQVTSMENMFSHSACLTSLNLSGFDTSQVTDMYCMFDGCSSLVALDLTGFDTSQVTDMSCMFYRCSALTSLDLS